jgi:predicted enzyme related to lactoylglutathione lyase
MAKAVGVGGVFFKARDPKALAAWYATHFTITAEDGGASLVFGGPESAGMTIFAHFPQDTKYFGDGPQTSMLNLRVDDLDALLAQLEAAGVRIDPHREDYAYGRFAWIWDPEGNRVELWQPA